MTEKLKPCPFCNGPVHRRMMGDVEGCFHIGAPHCPVESNRMMTLEQWNARPTDEAVVEKLVGALTYIAETTDDRHASRKAFEAIEAARKQGG